jgi:hypothetical protein
VCPYFVVIVIGSLLICFLVRAHSLCFLGREFLLVLNSFLFYFLGRCPFFSFTPPYDSIRLHTPPCAPWLALSWPGVCNYSVLFCFLFFLRHLSLGIFCFGMSARAHTHTQQSSSQNSSGRWKRVKNRNKNKNSPLRRIQVRRWRRACASSRTGKTSSED